MLFFCFTVCVCVLVSFFFFNPPPPSLLFFPPSSYLVCFTCEHSVFLPAPVFLSDERVGRFQRATQLVLEEFFDIYIHLATTPTNLPPSPLNVCKQTGPHTSRLWRGGSLKVQVSVFSTKWEHASVSARIPLARALLICVAHVHACTQPTVTRANTLEHCFM